MKDKLALLLALDMCQECLIDGSRSQQQSPIFHGQGGNALYGGGVGLDGADLHDALIKTRQRSNRSIGTSRHQSVITRNRHCRDPVRHFFTFTLAFWGSRPREVLYLDGRFEAQALPPSSGLKASPEETSIDNKVEVNTGELVLLIAVSIPQPLIAIASALLRFHLAIEQVVDNSRKAPSTDGGGDSDGVRRDLDSVSLGSF